MDPDLRLSIELVQPADKERILSFCVNSFGWGDYIPGVWGKWLSDPRGVFFKAVVYEKPVGICHVFFRNEAEGWLEGARVDPLYRRRGIASALLEHGVELAFRKRARVIRMGIEESNQPSLALVNKISFRTVTKSLRFEGCPKPSATTRFSRWAEDSDLDELWTFLLRSRLYVKSGRLYTKSWVWLELTRDVLTVFVCNNQAILGRAEGEISGLALVGSPKRMTDGDSHLQICYLDGSDDFVVDAITFFGEYCKAEGPDRVHVFICGDSSMIAILTGLGLERKIGLQVLERYLENKASA